MTDVTDAPVCIACGSPTQRLELQAVEPRGVDRFGVPCRDVVPVTVVACEEPTCRAMARADEPGVQRE